MSVYFIVSLTFFSSEERRTWTFLDRSRRTFVPFPRSSWKGVGNIWHHRFRTKRRGHLVPTTPDGIPKTYGPGYRPYHLRESFVFDLDFGRLTFETIPTTAVVITSVTTDLPRMIYKGRTFESTERETTLGVSIRERQRDVYGPFESFKYGWGTRAGVGLDLRPCNKILFLSTSGVIDQVRTTLPDSLWISSFFDSLVCIPT